MIYALTFLGLAFLIMIYISIRNQFVYEFQKKLIDMVYSSYDWELAHIIYQQGASYDRMVLSLKPLKLRYWYTNEEIKILTTKKQK